MDAVKRLQAGSASASARAMATAAVAKAVQDLQSVSTNRKPKNLAETRMRQAAADPAVIELRKQARKVFKDSGYLDEFATGAGTVTTGGSKKRATAVITLAGKAGNGAIKVADFQARLGAAIPKFRDAGLTPAQVQGVFKIIAEVLTN